MGWVMALVPLGLLLLGFPVFVVLLAASSVLLLFFMDVPLTLIPQIMFGSLDKYALMAVPFFIFAGEIMGQGGISKRIVSWVMAIFGGGRGALALTTVGACEFFGAVSGSSPATVAAIGRLLYPSLREQGYDERFSLGLITSSGAIASVIPPSIVMILYGASSEQSITALFVAGILPGLTIGVFMAVYIMVYARINDIPAYSSFDINAFLKTTRKAAWALGTPVVILGGIYAGVFSPTEAAGIAGMYGLLVTRFVYRDIGWKGIWDVTLKSVYLTSQIFVIVAASGVFSWLLTVSGVAGSMVAYISDIGAAPWMLLVVINIFLLLVGCLVDPTSAIIILTPLLVPLVRHAGIDLVHFGIILTVNLSIGMFTPPFGLNIFTTQALIRVPVFQIYRGVAPFIVVQILALILVTYVPDLSLILTRILVR
jgi:C4-dicarboxylate transporter DctM subunit